MRHTIRRAEHRSEYVEEGRMNAMIEEAVRDEAVLRAALAEADIAPLLMVLVQLSGDLAILDEVAPHIQGAWSFMETVPEALKQKVRDRLVDALQEYAATGRELPPHPRAEMLQRMMSAGVGQAVPDEYIPLLLEEMRFSEDDTRSVRWRREPSGAALADFRVIIIGAGFAGICAAVRLKEMGIPFLILEKNENVGGTWWENEYPGCAVDTPNHFFSYSFNPNPNWTRHFSRRDEILGYIEATADKYDVRRHVRFGVEVTSAEFDEDDALWRVAGRPPGRGAQTIPGKPPIPPHRPPNTPPPPPHPGPSFFHRSVLSTRPTGQTNQPQ